MVCRLVGSFILTDGRTDGRGVARSLARPLLQEYRQRLPAWSLREAIVRTVRKAQVVVISGETGCGKTTQVPQFLLDDALHAGQLLIHCQGVMEGIGLGGWVCRWMVGETINPSIHQSIARHTAHDTRHTGEGHTTNIICTQPRRISAIGVAERVAR